MSIQLKVLDVQKTKEFRKQNRFGTALMLGNIRKAKMLAKRYDMALSDQLDYVRAALEDPGIDPRNEDVIRIGSTPISKLEMQQRDAQLRGYLKELEGKGAKSDSMIIGINAHVVILKGMERTK